MIELLQRLGWVQPSLMTVADLGELDSLWEQVRAHSDRLEEIEQRLERLERRR